MGVVEPNVGRAATVALAFESSLSGPAPCWADVRAVLCGQRAEPAARFALNAERAWLGDALKLKVGVRVSAPDYPIAHEVAWQQRAGAVSQWWVPSGAQSLPIDASCFVARESLLISADPAENGSIRKSPMIAPTIK